MERSGAKWRGRGLGQRNRNIYCKLFFCQNDCPVKNENFFSIGDVAKMLKLPVHTIRYWTQTFEHIEFSTKNGRRYYDDVAIGELKKIKELAHKKGMKIEGIKQMLRYKKIDMNKFEAANKNDACRKLQLIIENIDKLIEKTKIEMEGLSS